MNEVVKYRRIIQLTSILLIGLMIAPIVLSTIVDDELFGYSLYENQKNEVEGHESETEDNEEKEEYVLINIYDQDDTLTFETKFIQLDFNLLGNNRFKILTPPPEHLIL